VPELTADGVDELVFMRKTLEPELARRAAERMTGALLEELRACDEVLNQAIARGDVNGYLTHNHRFHSLIYDAAEAPIMTESVHRLWLRFGPSLRVVCGRFGTSNLPDKHRELLDALAEGDIAATARAMEEDVLQGMRQIRSALDEQDVSG
jgi:DNA-binding GntR family transcriptional regulator